MTIQKIRNSLFENISNKSFIRISLMLLLIAIFVGLIYRQSNDTPSKFFLNNEEASTITGEELISTYGIRVRLIGITAAGGLIDVRLKVLDKDKAAILLKNPDNFPELLAENGTLIKVPVESTQEMPLEDDGIVFLLFPNTGGVVTPGSPVKIRFGDIILEPILAQ
jgi:hypothetical protein